MNRRFARALAYLWDSLAIGLKHLMPRSLFGRSLIIVAAPVVLLQVIATYVFYERHWDNVTRRLANSVAGEIATVIGGLEGFDSDDDKVRLIAMAQKQMGLKISYLPGQTLSGTAPPLSRFSILDGNLKSALRQSFADKPFQIDMQTQPDYVEIQVQLDGGVLRVLTRDKRLFASTSYLFILWMVGLSLVLLTIAIIFLRNQVRPVRQLAIASEMFGKGHDVADFRPAGAAEVRQAASAFLEMKDRIQRQIGQRTEMLAGVSHDLRTPLTRMKLQLAMLGESPEIADLRADVVEMENMVNGYLTFARGLGSEVAAEANIGEIVESVAMLARRHGADIGVELYGDLAAHVRPNAVKRCITNLVENARRYSSRIDVTASREPRMIRIQVDDNGPGIPPERREEVFRPFHRLDVSRNLETGGSGLGLTIARDIVRSHGGDITLDESPAGGLRVQIRLPI
ncbi:ATP-binding protein [Oceanibacterium hippocampi]|uniref:ATP-binding protein n=1 Tax=Oceanibacterium hippocampi TaxID=745714 RepID=UPI001C3921A8|nr:ATP-binding protein [Oceanibacterium hippocampi]